MKREEAIHIVKTTKDWSELREALAVLIPELAESEDERIRKCICMALTDVDEQRFKDFGTTLKDCLAYLEKQKERKLPEREGVYYYDGIGFHWICTPATEENPYDFAMSQQKEQKPTIWTDEDEKNLNELLAWGETRLGLRRWIAGLPEKIKGLQQKPVEWSEEDIQNIDNIIWLCANCEEGIENTWIPSQAKKIRELMERFKSLRPSWKPSEEEYIRKDSLLEWARDTLKLAVNTSPLTDDSILGYRQGIKALIDKIESL